LAAGAGQRCSALRVLCLQDDVADRTLTMLRGALAELSVGNPDRLSTDVGPVISVAARKGINDHVQGMREAGFAVHQSPLTDACPHGTFVAPTIIELTSLSALKREVFGPVLHVLRFGREALDGLMADIEATGYALTFGVHSRIDETIARVTARASAGNVYVNRNLIGAVVGVQPFGGHGLSGTGPKAGGPLYLRRLMSRRPSKIGLDGAEVPKVARAWADWLATSEGLDAASRFEGDLTSTPVGVERELAGPVGERNVYITEPKGIVMCVANGRDELLRQIGAALVTGNRVLVGSGMTRSIGDLPEVLSAWFKEADLAREDVSAILFSGSEDELQALLRDVAGRPGQIIPIYVAQADGRYPLEWLVQELSVSTNTTAAGGNANLMMIS
jgi:RHH-type proline utilization regulon transcriptional repressor/proline dehydrogenase/delta 1-pyrroline-5-carboxylate dehydrogenase